MVDLAHASALSGQCNVYESGAPLRAWVIQEEPVKDMDIKRGGSRSSNEGPAEWFTGKVRIEPLFQARAPGRVHGASVTFEPGAHAAWHTHPLGQTLIVTAGRGFVQSWGGPVQRIQSCDVVSCPPQEKHWHGAAPDSAMTHIAIQEELDGKVVNWMEKVSDEQYRRAASAKEVGRS